MAALQTMTTLLLVGLLGAAALHDAAFRTVPNWISLALACGGLALRGLHHDLLPGLAVALGLFALLALLWTRGLLGGGDVKLAGATALTVPPDAAPSFVLAVSLAGGVLALLYLALSLVVSRPAPGVRRSLPARLLKAEAWRVHRRGPLPYAAAIAAGCVFTLLPG
ncbi:MAG TPA: A24 family peptidase [Acetobacteraceae bacterium]|nr:A24 family peptidase [Acetobacteraceae bacterium]